MDFLPPSSVGCVRPVAVQAAQPPAERAAAWAAEQAALAAEQAVQARNFVVHLPGGWAAGAQARPRPRLKGDVDLTTEDRSTLRFQPGRDQALGPSPAGSASQNHQRRPRPLASLTAAATGQARVVLFPRYSHPGPPPPPQRPPRRKTPPTSPPPPHRKLLQQDPWQRVESRFRAWRRGRV